VPDLKCGPQVVPVVFNPPQLNGLGALDAMVESAFVKSSFPSRRPRLDAIVSSNGAGDHARVAGVLSLESTATLGGPAAPQVTTLEDMVEQVMLARGASVVLVPIAEGFGL
jgi:hypothetical protein